MKKTLTIILLIAAAAPLRAQDTAPLDKLADDFWTWRARYAPFNGDDVPRIERPGGMRDWSRASIDKRRKDLTEFEARWKKIDANKWPIAKQVDYRLIGSALSRVRWELDINPGWRRDPTFYIAQTLTALVEALTVPAPYDEARSREILTRIDNIPSIQVDWALYGPKLAQVALTVGADDIDAVSAQDDTGEGRRRAPLEEIRRNIRAAGFGPVERNGRFDVLAR